MKKIIDDKPDFKERRKRDSARRFQNAIRNFSTNDLWSIFKKIADETYPSDFIDKDNLLSKITLSTYEGLSCGNRYWDEDKFPTIEEIFKVVLVSEARNSRVADIKYSLFISNNQDESYTSKFHSEASQDQKNPEELMINDQNYTLAIEELQSLFNFLEKEDKEVHKIIKCCYQQSINLNKNQKLAKALSMPISTIVRAKRRIRKLRKLFLSQRDGGLL